MHSHKPLPQSCNQHTSIHVLNSRLRAVLEVAVVSRGCCEGAVGLLGGYFGGTQNAKFLVSPLSKSWRQGYRAGQCRDEAGKCCDLAR